MSEEIQGARTLQAVEQKTVLFLSDELIAIRAADGHIYVSVRHLCHALGLDAQGQMRRITRQTILDEGFKGVDNLSTPGGHQSAYVLRVDLIPLWLSGIRTSAVKEEIRSKLEHYQREAAKVLWEAFQAGRLTADFTLDELLVRDTPAAQAYKIAAAIMKMAQQQLFLEAQIGSQAMKLADHEQRLEQIEATLGDVGRFISTTQASQISQAVKAIAMEMGKQSKRNEYGGVYGELYRRYQIPEYRMLPASKFEDAMKWLRDWYQSLTGTVVF